MLAESQVVISPCVSTEHAQLLFSFVRAWRSSSENSSNAPTQKTTSSSTDQQQTSPCECHDTLVVLVAGTHMQLRSRQPRTLNAIRYHVHTQVLLASLLCAVVLLLGAYERSLSTSASSSISSRIRVSHRTTACEPEPATTHHHPLLRQHQQHQQQPFSPPAPNNSHLIQPLHSAVGASRTALQAYLNSPSFASEVEQLDQAASARWAAVGQHKSTTPTAAAGATSSQQSNSESNSSSRPTHGVLVVAGGKKLLTHLVVQLKVRMV